MSKSKMFVVCGLGFGDEGKGTITDFLVRTHGIRHVVRYNGGPQAGHNVVVPDGLWHCFAQFGSGTLVPGTKTLLSREMFIEPENLLVEAEALANRGAADACERLTMDADATIVTPAHKMVGQMLELSRGERRFGSCGMGVGQAVFDRERGASIRLRDACDAEKLERKVRFHVEEKIEEARRLSLAHASREVEETLAYFSRRADPVRLTETYTRFVQRLQHAVDLSGGHLRAILMRGESVVFEGAQGALLDRRFGFAPYVTKTRATFHNVEGLLETPLEDSALQGRYDVVKLGITRVYSHRHGAGPFVTELPKLRTHFRDPWNVSGPWQGEFRVGWLDLLALRYGIAVNGGVDALALTCLDQLSRLDRIPVCTAYLYEGQTHDLDRVAVWEPAGKLRARISGLKPSCSEEDQSRLTRVLENCRPLELRMFRGWQKPLSEIRRFGELPGSARAFLEFLQSEEGVGVPVTVVSVGPRSDQKFFFET